MLNQYIELVGPQLITDGLDVFEKMMPLPVCPESNLTARDQKGITEEGHKNQRRGRLYRFKTFTATGKTDPISRITCMVG